MDITSYLLGKNTAGGGGSSKFTYEEGTWTPTEDTNRGEISYINTHSKCPAFIQVLDIGDNQTTDNSIVFFDYVDYYQLFGKTMTNRYSNDRYKGLAHGLYTASTTINNIGNHLTYGIETIKDSYNKEYARYYVDEQKFYPNIGSNTRMWRANRPYKWVAIWVDE